MQLIEFRVQMYKCILDSGWVKVSPLTVLVGKNEAGKTSLLKALHKFNPYSGDGYSMDREWPRGHRKKRDSKQIVCSIKLQLSAEETGELAALTDQKMTLQTVEVSKDYGGSLEVHFSQDLFPDKLHPNKVDDLCHTLPSLSEPIAEQFKKQVDKLSKEIKKLAQNGQYSELAELSSQHNTVLSTCRSPEGQAPQFQNEQNYISQHTTWLNQISQRVSTLPSMQKEAHEYIINRLPTFVYMDEYRSFCGTAWLDQVKTRKDRNGLSDDDKTLLMIMELSGLDLESEVKKGAETDREQRQYDLDDAAATLTKEIAERWRQKKYEVGFRADGQQFFTFVKDEKDQALIRLEERSKGFQWFFSFDLMFMYESQGTFEDCVILLDEPGLHLHPDAQRDLLDRLESYAEGNTLLYTTHLPFMIDLRQPDRIRVLNETTDGTKVTEDLTQSQPEARFTLQAALGMSGSQSYLLSHRNLVVEGVDDYWVVSELSNLLKRSGESGLDDDIFITAAGGASEAAYIATLMIGQKLSVAVLLDSDPAGEQAAEKLIKKWLTKYNSTAANVLSVADAVKKSGSEFAIEDLFPDDFYVQRAQSVYAKQLTAAGVSKLKVSGKGMICKRTEAAFSGHGINYNKGSVAKVIRNDLLKMKSVSDLPPETLENARNLIGAINNAIPG